MRTWFELSDWSTGDRFRKFSFTLKNRFYFGDARKQIPIGMIRDELNSPFQRFNS